MYEGLIKRGLAALGGFFLLIYLTALFNFWPLNLIFGLSIPVYYFACIFDAFNIRRRINAGEAVSDDVDGALRFIKRNKFVIIGFILLLLVLSFVRMAFDLLSFNLNWLPITIVALGIYMLFKSPGRKKVGKGKNDAEYDE
jgi:hypothetical protein